LPVILMTAHGSESIALDALRAGAATYVPKEALADSLTDSIARVLSLSQADQAENQLLACLRATNLSFEVENDPELIETLIRVVRRHLKGIDFESESARLQIAVALEQALLNALYRGNLELTEDELEAAREAQLMGGDANQVERRSAEPLYKDRRIYVEIDVAPEKVQFTVRDDGPGFDVDRFADPSPDTIGKAVPGRGILLMKTFMDEVNYNDKGNEVTLIKRSSNGAVRAEGAPV
jgi:CheY-like chemotaxis protein